MNVLLCIHICILHIDHIDHIQIYKNDNSIKMVKYLHCQRVVQNICQVSRPGTSLEAKGCSRVSLRVTHQVFDV